MIPDKAPREGYRNPEEEVKTKSSEGESDYPPFDPEKARKLQERGSREANHDTADNDFDKEKNLDDDEIEVYDFRHANPSLEQIFVRAATKNVPTAGDDPTESQVKAVADRILDIMQAEKVSFYEAFKILGQEDSERAKNDLDYDYHDGYAIADLEGSFENMTATYIISKEDKKARGFAKGLLTKYEMSIDNFDNHEETIAYGDRLRIDLALTKPVLNEFIENYNPTGEGSPGDLRRFLETRMQALKSINTIDKMKGNQLAPDAERRVQALQSMIDQLRIMEEDYDKNLKILENVATGNGEKRDFDDDHADRSSEPFGRWGNLEMPMKTTDETPNYYADDKNDNWKNGVRDGNNPEIYDFEHINQEQAEIFLLTAMAMGNSDNVAKDQIENAAMRVIDEVGNGKKESIREALKAQSAEESSNPEYGPSEVLNENFDTVVASYVIGKDEMKARGLAKGLISKLEMMIDEGKTDIPNEYQDQLVIDLALTRPILEDFIEGYNKPDTGKVEDLRHFLEARVESLEALNTIEQQKGNPLTMDAKRRVRALRHIIDDWLPSLEEEARNGVNFQKLQNVARAYNRTI